MNPCTRSKKTVALTPPSGATAAWANARSFGNPPAEGSTWRNRGFSWKCSSHGFLSWRPSTGAGQFSHSGPPPVRFPGRHGWLVTALAHHGAYYTVQFEALLHEPFAVAFLAANPAVTAILRPIWRMLAVHPSLLPPRPPRRPRNPTPAPEPMPSAAPAPQRRPLPRLVLDAITPVPNRRAKPA